MANDLVVTLGAKLDKFAADMNQAGDIADGAVSKIEKSFAGLNPGINLAALTGGGALAALTGLFAALSNINSELAELAKNAEYAGVSVERFQQLRFAATQGGVGSAEATADLRNMAKLLEDAKWNENSLTKLLDANNIKWKDRNGEVIKLNQTITIMGDLLKKFDSIPDKTKAAEMGGLTEKWVDALKGGGAAFNDLANKAQDAGAVIDSQTIRKAAEFDEAWKKSSALLAVQFKVVTAEAAGYLNDLIGKAGEFLTELTKARGETPGGGQEKFNRAAEAAAVLAKDAAGAAQDVEQLTRVIDNMMKSGGGDPEIIATLRRMREEAQKTAEFIQQALTMEAAKGLEFPGGKVPLPQGRPTPPPPPKGGGVLPGRGGGGGGGADDFERATKQIDKHTAAMQAQAATLGETAYEQELYRVQLILTEKAIDQYGEVSPAMNDQIALTSERAARAKQALADMHHQMQQINALGQTLGSALSTAFGDAVLEGKKLNEVTSQLLKTLAKAAINWAIMAPFQSGPGGAASPFASIFSGIFGKPAGAAAGTNYSTSGLTMVGEKGPELVNLPRGSQVIPNDVLKGAAGASSIVYSPAIDARGASVEAVARLAQIMEADRASFASRTVQTIQQARRGRIPGI